MALGSPPEGTVSVVVRVRPPAPCERERAAHPVLHVMDDHVIVLDHDVHGGPPGSALTTRAPKHPGKDIQFVFDRVFGEGATQDEVFQHTTRGLLDTVLDGYNCSVFAYGATGAGKTYTMLGSEESPGIMYRTMEELYRRVEARKEEKSCEVLVSYQEVYNEQVFDLLEPKGPLSVREDPERGVVIQGLSFHQPSSAEHLLGMLARGNQNRTQHPTDANATSSRSHAIFQICVKQQDRIGGLTRDLQVAKMSLVDLAGSERASVANTKGERLREGANINRSLLALINVINALADVKSKKTHIPYRDSKLTRLLKDSIGGNCRTVMIAAVSPSVLAYEDTYNTLKYANRAKEIKLSLKSNVLSVDCHISQYAVVCKQLQAEVADLKTKLRAYEDAAQKAKNQALVAPLGVSPAGPHRLEECVPKPHSALDGDSKQQELGAGWPVHLQLEPEEEAPEEMLHSSARATYQLEPKEPSCLLQGLSGSRTEKLIAAILSVARKQYSILQDANLLTPDMVSEFEELERLVRQETGVTLERTASPSRAADVTGASAAPGCDAEASVAVPSIAVPSDPTTSIALQCLQQLTPRASSVPTAPSPVRKRRNAVRSSAAMRSAKRNSAETHSAVSSAEIHSSALNSAEMHSAKRNSAETHSAVSSAEMHSSALNSAEMHSAKRNSAEMHSAKRNSAEMHSTVSSAEMHSSAWSSAEMCSAMKDAEVRSVQMRGAMKDAEVRSVQMRNAMKDAEMRSVQMHGAMKDAEVRSVQMHGAMKDAEVCSVQMHGAMNSAEMCGVQMCSAMNDAEMHRAALSSAEMHSAMNSAMKDAEMCSVQMRSAMNDAEMHSAVLSSAEMHSADMHSPVLNRTFEVETPCSLKRRVKRQRSSAEMHSAALSSAEMHSSASSSAGMCSAMHGAVMHSAEMRSAMNSAEMRSVQMRSAMNDAEMHSAALSSAEMHSADMHSPVLNRTFEVETPCSLKRRVEHQQSSAEMHSAEMHSAALSSAEMCSAMHGAVMHSAEMRSAMNSAEMRSVQMRSAVNDAEMHSAALSSAEMHSAEMHSPVLNRTFEVETPCSLKRRVKRQRSTGSAAETLGAMLSPGSPCLAAAAAQAPLVSPLPSYCTPKLCPLTVPKSRVPLAVSAAQNCCAAPAAPAHKLNETFEVCRYSGSPGPADPAAFSGPEISMWENVQSLLNKQDGPVVPTACVPAPPAKASSIPKAPAQKRRRVESAAPPSLGGLQSHITNLPSTRQRCAQPSRIPVHPPGALPRKSRTRSTKDPVASVRTPNTRTPKLRKLLC